MAREAEAGMVMAVRRVLVGAAAKIHHDDAVGGADFDMEGAVLRRGQEPQAMRHRQAALQAEHQGKHKAKKVHATPHGGMT